MIPDDERLGRLLRLIRRRADMTQEELSTAAGVPVRDVIRAEAHAAIVERVSAVLRRRGWEVRVEVSFSEFGERGSIDVLAAPPSRRAVAVFEIKSDIGSIEELNRSFDIETRRGSPARRTARLRTPYAPGRSSSSW